MCSEMCIRDRPLKHMADDLGHSSMGTTDQVYIKSDMKERAATEKSRKVNKYQSIMLLSL